MKKLLIISPHFPPINAPDMQRVRMALPYLRSHGWEPTVLAIAPEPIEGGVIEQKLTETYPADIRVIRSNGISAKYTRWAGFGNLWLRCGRSFTKAGEELLNREHFDLALISTTQFAAFKLGPKWLRKFGLPYVLDYQDPWVNDYYQITGVSPPGGSLKFWLSQWQAGMIEPRALRDASGIVAVSDSYGAMLANQYPWFLASRAKLLPFGAAPMDFERLGSHVPAKPIIDFKDGFFHQVYVGRCGPDMSVALKVVFRAFKKYSQTHPEKASRMRFHFIGTDYAPPPLGHDWALPVAKEENVLEFVQEHRYRVPYFDSLYYLRNADALVAVGSNDPTYSASKFFSYILAMRPLMMVFHAKSPVLRFAQNLGIPSTWGFSGPSDIPQMADRIYQKWYV
ncbi:MAG TPA: hypothetical protein VFE25_02885, partial [Opitutaceae bacterium]|nr:hypothetical protein [Opitutaceae bacterium]